MEAFFQPTLEGNDKCEMLLKETRFGVIFRYAIKMLLQIKCISSLSSFLGALHRAHNITEKLYCSGMKFTSEPEPEQRVLSCTHPQVIHKYNWFKFMRLLFVGFFVDYILEEARRDYRAREMKADMISIRVIGFQGGEGDSWVFDRKIVCYHIKNSIEFKAGPEQTSDEICVELKTHRGLRDSSRTCRLRKVDWLWRCKHKHGEC